MATPQKDSFAEYRVLILAELERLNGAVNALNNKLDGFRNEDISRLQVEVAMLKVRAGLIGAMGGTIGGAVIGALVARFIK